MAAAIAVSSPNPTILQNLIAIRDSSSGFFGGTLSGFSFQLKSRSRKRDISTLVVASSSAAGDITRSSKSDSGRFYLNFTGFPFPLGPFLNRRTIRTEVCFFISSFGFNQILMVIRFDVGSRIK